ncbi:MAG: nucleoside deaminase [Candidatus Omnitrophica bacterium]|nr:nucleoside deaminase [Candidatus Omnitrophota bacterium]
MRRAISEARQNIRTMDGGPFGACIIRAGKLLAVGRNTVLKNDATCHAEVNAIRSASRKLKTFDLSGCIIYSTTEPCPMCFSAIHWAKIDHVIFGTTIGDVKKIGFNELTISASLMKRLGASKVKVTAHCLVLECRKLLKDWNAQKNKTLY